MTAMSTFFVVYYLLILPIGIGFLSHAYRHFFCRAAKGPEGRNNSPCVTWLTSRRADPVHDAGIGS